MRHYYVVVREILTAEPVEGKPSMLKSISVPPRAVVVKGESEFQRITDHYVFFLVFFFLPRSHREAADHIEAVASRAVRASKQTFGFLMDLLQDNSTEEYIRNLTER